MTEREITEAALRACDGDELAFERLCREFAPMMRAAVRHFYAPGLTRDDLMQEARVGLYAACVSFDAQRPFAALATTAVQRRVIDAVKTAQRSKHGPLNAALSLEAPAGDGGTVADFMAAAPSFSDPARQVEGRDELRRLVAHLLAVMSPLEVVVLGRVLSGASYEDASVGVGRGGDAVKTVDNAMQRIRRKARAVLGEVA